MRWRVKLLFESVPSSPLWAMTGRAGFAARQNVPWSVPKKRQKTRGLPPKNVNVELARSP